MLCSVGRFWVYRIGVNDGVRLRNTAREENLGGGAADKKETPTFRSEHRFGHRFLGRELSNYLMHPAEKNPAVWSGA